MNPIEFRAKWTATGEGLLDFTDKHFAETDLSADVRQYLIQSGLPLSAAPFLELDEFGYRRLQRITERYPAAPRHYSNYRCIGHQKMGGAICVCEHTGRVSALNHDSEFAPLLINSSVGQFAASLLAFRDLVVSGTPTGDHIYYGFDVPVEIANIIKSAIQSIDSNAMSPDAFWPLEFAEMVKTSG